MDGFDSSKFKVQDAPENIYYVPYFISPQKEQQLLKDIYDAPKPKWVQLANRRLQNWGGNPHPKGMVAEKIPAWLQTCLDDVTNLNIFPPDKLPNHVLINEYMPGQGIMPHVDGPLYHPIIATISLESSVLLDIYKPTPSANQKKESSANHIKDSQSPLAITQPTMIPKNGDTAQTAEPQLQNNESKTSQPEIQGSIFLEARSLYIATDDVYHSHMHGIRETRACDLTGGPKVWNLKTGSEKSFDRTTKRVSITIRHVPKVLKNKIFLCK